jgi:hypothetical protein
MTIRPPVFVFFLGVGVTLLPFSPRPVHSVLSPSAMVLTLTQT